MSKEKRGGPYVLLDEILQDLEAMVTRYGGSDEVIDPLLCEAARTILDHSDREEQETVIASILRVGINAVAKTEEGS